jgi:hypothetical protein
MLVDSPMADEIVMASAVDELPSDYVHTYIDLQFDDIQKEVLAKPSLSSYDRAWFEREANNLQAKYKEILAAEDSPLKDAALRAVASALCMSFYYVGGPQARLDLTARAREERMRKGLDFQVAVDEEARKLRARSRGFMNSTRGTARKIYSAVAAKMDSLQNPPEWWKPQAAKQVLGSEVFENAKQYLRDETFEETKKRRIDAIRKRISRTQLQDQ